jgi:hypothetical protein
MTAYSSIAYLAGSKVSRNKSPEMAGQLELKLAMDFPASINLKRFGGFPPGPLLWKAPVRQVAQLPINRTTQHTSPCGGNRAGVGKVLKNRAGCRQVGAEIR